MPSKIADRFTVSIPDKEGYIGPGFGFGRLADRENAQRSPTTDIEDT
jgi:hypothetical protein